MRMLSAAGVVAACTVNAANMMPLTLQLRSSASHGVTSSHHGRSSREVFVDEDSDEGDVDVEEYYEEEEFFLDEDEEPTVVVSIAKFIKQCPVEDIGLSYERQYQLL